MAKYAKSVKKYNSRRSYLEQLAAEFMEIDDQYRTIRSKRNALREIIFKNVKEGRTLVGNYCIDFSIQMRKQFDTKTFSTKYPELYDEFYKPGQVRYLTVRSIDE